MLYICCWTLQSVWQGWLFSCGQFHHLSFSLRVKTTVFFLSNLHFSPYMELWVYIPDVQNSFCVYSTPFKQQRLAHFYNGQDLNLLHSTVCMANQSLVGQTLKAVCLLNKSLVRITSQPHQLGSGPRLFSAQPRTFEQPIVYNRHNSEL